jgi:hypothetical protein
MNSNVARDKFFFMSPKERDMWLLRNYVLLALTIFVLGGNSVAWVTFTGVVPLFRAVAHLAVMVACVACGVALIMARPDHDPLKRWVNWGD